MSQLTHERRIDLVTESVVRLDQKLDRTAAELRDEMRCGFADTQAMIFPPLRSIGAFNDVINA